MKTKGVSAALANKEALTLLSKLLNLISSDAVSLRSSFHRDTESGMKRPPPPAAKRSIRIPVRDQTTLTQKAQVLLHEKGALDYS